VKEALWKGEQSRLRDMVKGEVDSVTSHMVHQALVQGDALAARVWNETTHALGTGIANLINIFNPDLVVLGGGLVLAGKDLLEPVKREVKRQAFQRPAQTAKIVASKLGEDAGVIGAAVMGLVRSGQNI
jgi:glucokinase